MQGRGGLQWLLRTLHGDNLCASMLGKWLPLLRASDDLHSMTAKKLHAPAMPCWYNAALLSDYKCGMTAAWQVRVRACTCNAQQCAKLIHTVYRIRVLQEALKLPPYIYIIFVLLNAAAEGSATQMGCTGAWMLQIVREWLPSRQACLRINIDATRVGNVARFFNHSCCGGNLELVVVRCSGSPLPHVGMFARRQIRTGEELTFLYGDPSDGAEAVTRNGGVRRACYCEAKGCLGFLPAESV